MHRKSVDAAEDDEAFAGPAEGVEGMQRKGSPRRVQVERAGSAQDLEGGDTVRALRGRARGGSSSGTDEGGGAPACTAAVEERGSGGRRTSQHRVSQAGMDTDRGSARAAPRRKSSVGFDEATDAKEEGRAAARGKRASEAGSMRSGRRLSQASSLHQRLKVCWRWSGAGSVCVYSFAHDLGLHQGLKVYRQWSGAGSVCVCSLAHDLGLHQRSKVYRRWSGAGSVCVCSLTHDLGLHQRSKVCRRWSGAGSVSVCSLMILACPSV